MLMRGFLWWKEEPSYYQTGRLRAMIADLQWKSSSAIITIYQGAIQVYIVTDVSNNFENS